MAVKFQLLNADGEVPTKECIRQSWYRLQKAKLVTGSMGRSPKPQTQPLTGSNSFLNTGAHEDEAEPQFAPLALPETRKAEDDA